jgi:hypothetical protein
MRNPWVTVPLMLTSICMAFSGWLVGVAEAQDSNG